MEGCDSHSGVLMVGPKLTGALQSLPSRRHQVEARIEKALHQLCWEELSGGGAQVLPDGWKAAERSAENPASRRLPRRL